MKGIVLKAKRVFVVALVIIMFTGVIPVQAASVWSFTAGSGKKITVNGTVEFKKNEYQNINLFKGGKEIKENDKTYKVTWSSSDTDVVWINKNSGQMRADKYKKLTKSTATAKITATIKNKKTGKVAKRSFTAKVVGNNMSSIPSPTPTSTPSPVAHTIYDGTTVELSKAKVGDVVLFGVYEQDNIKSNGAEAIPWYVLDRDGDKLLLMSVYLLDCIKNNEKYTNITWEDCTLRQWMNNEFYNSAFTKSEKKHILTSYLKNEDNPFYRIEGGNDTEDKVFALSLEEVTQYFGIADKIAGGSYWVSAAPELSGAEVTAYAEAQGAYVSTVGNGWWRLRSSGSFDGDVAYIDDELIALGSYDGVLYVRGESVVRSSNAARPALWLELNSSVATPTPTNTPAVNTAESVINKKNVKVGSYITLGNFEQDNMEENGKEPIEWLVLEVQDDKALVISKYGLISKQYDETGAGETWENCSLRKWLNGEFFETTFTNAEQTRILESQVKNNEPVGNVTMDQVFLLSQEEVERYFPDSVWDETYGAFRYMSRQTPPTRWGGFNKCYYDITGACFWWLRTSGGETLWFDGEKHTPIQTANQVGQYGEIGPYWPVTESKTVRPAMWVKLDSKASATAAPSPTPTNTPSPLPTATPSPTPTNTPSPTPTNTPSPTPTNTPSLTPNKRYGVLSYNGKINVGMNPEMTGGTYGAIYQGAKLDILSEHTNSKGVLVYRVYSHDLSRECYVSAKYVTLEQASVVVPEVVPENDKVYGTLTATRYNVGINANLTGGTLGEIKKGAQLEILEEVTNASGVKVYRVYSPDLNKECYVSAKYVTINDGSSKIFLANIAEGVYAIHPKCAPNSSLDVAGWNAENGANLQIWETTKLESNQLFRIKRENGYYVLQSEFSQKMIDVSGAVFESQNNVQLYEANGSDAQKWIITDAGNGYYMLIPYGNMNLALDVSGGGNANGSNMWLYEINKSDAQLFKLERYYGSTEGLSRYECFSRNASIVLEQIKNGTSEYINVGETAYKKVWTWYYQKADPWTNEWCGVFAHYVLCLAGVDTLAYKGSVTYNVGGARDYYKDLSAYTYVADANKSGMDIYDMVRTGDLIMMNGHNHIGVVYVEGDKKYVIHGNYDGSDYTVRAVRVHELLRKDASTGVNYANGKSITIDGYVSMEAFLSNNTDIEVSRELPTKTYKIGNYTLGGMH